MTLSGRQTLIPLAILGACVGALALAYLAQYVYGLEPCPLCLYQRVPYAVGGLMATAAVLSSVRGLRVAAVAIAGLAFAVGAAIAVHHVGVEQHWWASAAGCGGQLALPESPAELLAELSRPPAKACDQPAWTLFGVSMAGYNIVASGALASFAFLGAWTMREKAENRP